MFLLPVLDLTRYLGTDAEGFVQTRQPEMSLWLLGLVLTGKSEEEKLQGRGKGKGSLPEAQRKGGKAE